LEALKALVSHLSKTKKTSHGQKMILVAVPQVFISQRPSHVLQYQIINSTYTRGMVARSANIPPKIVGRSLSQQKCPGRGHLSLDTLTVIVGSSIL
jgi:hypothetical protein